MIIAIVGFLEAVAWRCSVKKVFLDILQNSQKNSCARVSFSIKLQAEACNFIKKRLWDRCFPVNFAETAILLKQTLAQMSPCEFCGISRINFSYKIPLVAASGFTRKVFFINSVFIS